MEWEEEQKQASSFLYTKCQSVGCDVLALG